MVDPQGNQKYLAATHSGEFSNAENAAATIPEDEIPILQELWAPIHDVDYNLLKAKTHNARAIAN